MSLMMDGCSYSFSCDVEVGGSTPDSFVFVIAAK
jgi:hypothetical protein